MHTELLQGMHENSHNVLLLLQAAGQQVAKTYLTWQGTYAAVALFALQPAVFGEGCYVVVTWILVTVFVLSNFYFFRVLFGRIGGRNISVTFFSGLQRSSRCRHSRMHCRVSSGGTVQATIHCSIL